MAGRAQRLTWVVLALLLGGGFVSVALTVSPSPWIAILLCSALLLTIFEPVTWALTAELAGESRATANGLLATSNQLGIIGGASAGGSSSPWGLPVRRALLPRGCHRCCCRRHRAQTAERPGTPC